MYTYLSSCQAYPCPAPRSRLPWRSPWRDQGWCFCLIAGSPWTGQSRHWTPLRLGHPSDCHSSPLLGCRTEKGGKQCNSDHHVAKTGWEVLYCFSAHPCLSHTVTFISLFYTSLYMYIDIRSSWNLYIIAKTILLIAEYTLKFCHSSPVSEVSRLWRQKIVCVISTDGGLRTSSQDKH